MKSHLAKNDNTKVGLNPWHLNAMTTDPICTNNDLPVTKIFKFATLLVNVVLLGGLGWSIFTDPILGLI